MGTWVLIYILATSNGIATNSVAGIGSEGECLVMGNNVKRASAENGLTLWASFSCNNKG